MILYVKYDENGAILTVSDGSFNDAEEIEIQDDSYITDPSSIYNYKIVNHEFAYIEEEEKKQLYSFLYPDELETKKAMQELSLQAMMTASARTSFLVELPDEKAVKIPLCYPSWESYKGKPLTKLNEQGKENRIEYQGELWKVRQDIPVVLENQPPSIKTASLYERIDDEHAGTLEDPIPYDQTMTVYNGKYYQEEGIIYKCIRDSGQPLYATCASLVGNYFEVAR